MQNSVLKEIADVSSSNCKTICITIAVCVVSIAICSCTAVSFHAKMKADEAKYIFLLEETKNSK